MGHRSAKVSLHARDRETDTTGSGEVQLMIAHLPPHRYKIIYGHETTEFHADGARPLRLRIPAGSSTAVVEIVRS